MIQLYDFQMMGTPIISEWLKFDELLTKYKVVFKELKGLPPVRFQDHQIILKEGVQPINLRTYKYEGL